jgi:hypothetical protein
MTRSQIDSAIQSGAAFKLRMADGQEYDVPHRDYISVSPKGTFVTVYDDDEGFVILPLLTMTGLASKGGRGNGSTAKE